MNVGVCALSTIRPSYSALRCSTKIENQGKCTANFNQKMCRHFGTTFCLIWIWILNKDLISA